MGYIGTPCSSALQKLFTDGNRQVCRITVTPLSGTPFVLTEEKIYSLTIDRYSATGEELTLGSCVSSEINLSLNNQDYSLNQYQFAGAILDVQVGVADWSLDNPTVQYINVGRFTVDEAPRMLQTINIVGLDNLALFDKYSNLTGSTTIGTLITTICNRCGVAFDYPLSGRGIPNLTATVKIPEDDNITYRQLLIWACQLCGAIGYIDYLGRFTLDVYQANNTSTVQPIVTLSPSVRYSSDVAENSITITGIEAHINGNEEPYRDENYQDGYVISIENKLLDEENIQEIVNGIGSVYNGFSYTPYNANVKSMPWLMPASAINYVAKQYVDGNGQLLTETDDVLSTENGNTIVTQGRPVEVEEITLKSIVTNVTFTLNGGTVVAGKGKTAENKGYASTGYLTPQQQTIVDNLKDDVENDTKDQVNLAKRTLLAINEAMYNSMGFYSTTIENPDGSKIIYCHNKANLSDSNIVYKITENGVGWTTNYDGEQTIWRYGVDAQGNAVFSTIVTNNLSANYVRAGVLESNATYLDTKGEKHSVSWIDLDTGRFSFGSKYFFDLAYFPLLSLDNEGMLSIFGRIRSHLDKDLSMGFTAGGFSLINENDKEVLLARPFFDVTRTKSGNKKAGFTISSDTLGGAYNYFTMHEDDCSIRHGGILSYSVLSLSNTNSGNSFRLTASNISSRASIQGDAAGDITIETTSTSGRVNLISKAGITLTCGSGTTAKTVSVAPSGDLSCPSDVNAYNGTVWAKKFETFSAREMKENIVQISPDALKNISNMKFYTYDYITGGKAEIGVIADEVPKEILSENAKAIDNYAFVSYLARAVQQLNDKVDALSKELRGEN